MYWYPRVCTCAPVPTTTGSRIFPLVLRPICVESGAWIAADAFIGPGVTIGAGSVVGARAVVVRNVPPRSVVVGNPARVIKKTAPCQ
jgi:putative colanic acid biosynthesis acetyltransferase WcaF